MMMRLLVVTDGTDAALGALRLARALAQKRAATVDVLAVVPPPSPPPAKVDGSPGDPSEAEASAVVAMLDVVARQLGGLGASVGWWPVTVRIGSAAETITQIAREVGASLILLSLPRDRATAVADAATTLDVVHLARLPVIGVSAAVTDLPRRYLVGVDLHAPALDSLMAVLLEISDPVAIDLAHVAWEVGPSGPGETQAWKAEYVSRVAEHLGKLAERLRLAAPARVNVHVPLGDWDEGLVGLANRLAVDLVATGSHAYGELGRAFTRSVSTAVLHGATCSVLIVPTMPLPSAPARLPTEDVATLPTPNL
jgi:nucleotide-binding universal stress UspA family protein